MVGKKFLEMPPLGMEKVVSVFGLCRRYANVDIGPMNVDQQKTKQSDTIRKLLQGPLKGPMSNMAQSFPVTVENISH